MSHAWPLRLTRRAAREIQEAAEWWEQNRPAAPNAFREAIEDAFRLLQAQPKLGPVAMNFQIPGVRRLHLSRVRYYLYYRLKTRPKAVELLALWHTSRYPDPSE